MHSATEDCINAVTCAGVKWVVDTTLACTFFPPALQVDGRLVPLRLAYCD